MSKSSPSPPGSDSERNSDNNFEEIVNPEDLPSAESKPISIEEFDKNLPETVTLMKGPTGSKVYLIGTAHFSEQSQNDVATVIQMVQPHIVMVELCKSRINILLLDEKTLLEKAKNINMEKIMNTVKQNGIFNGLMYILLLSMNAHLTKELEMAPGGEFRRVFAEAKKVNHCAIQLGDRPIHITIQRAVAKLSWFQTLKLCWRLMTSKDPISKEDVEQWKRRDMLEELLAEMAAEFPALGEVFVHERDIFLTHSLQNAAMPQLINGQLESKRVVGVVGMGHIPGIIKRFPEVQTPYIPEIMTIPPQSLTSKIVRVSFRLSLLAFGGILIYRYVPGTKGITHSIINSCQNVANNIIKYTRS